MRSGRFSVMVATLPSCSYSTVLDIVSLPEGE
jgi:hypothetical protein